MRCFVIGNPHLYGCRPFSRAGAHLSSGFSSYTCRLVSFEGSCSTGVVCSGVVVNSALFGGSTGIFGAVDG